MWSALYSARTCDNKSSYPPPPPLAFGSSSASSVPEPLGLCRDAHGLQHEPTHPLEALRMAQSANRERGKRAGGVTLHEAYPGSDGEHMASAEAVHALKPPQRRRAVPVRPT